MMRSITEENLRLFPIVLATLTETSALLLQIDCQDEHTPPQVNLLLLLSVIRGELEKLLCAILRPEEEHIDISLRFVERHCCKVILQTCSALAELLQHQLRLYMSGAQPSTPSWAEICTSLASYRMHLLFLDGNLKE